MKLVNPEVDLDLVGAVLAYFKIAFHRKVAERLRAASHGIADKARAVVLLPGAVQQYLVAVVRNKFAGDIAQQAVADLPRSKFIDAGQQLVRSQAAAVDRFDLGLAENNQFDIVRAGNDIGRPAVAAAG